MARIIGAVASSHTPTIGFALDKHKETDPVWAPIFEGYKPVQHWLAAQQPDVLLMVFNDHVTSFFFDHYSHFALGIGESYAPADEGGGPRALPPVRGHAPLAHHIAAGLVADEFDLSYFQDKALDHGCFSPLSMLWPHEPTWPGAIVPLQIGVLEFPIPSARRCYNLGHSLRKAIESYPEDLKVVLVATGGLSHQVHGERCGFNNTEWDRTFLELIEKDPERLAAMTHAEYAALGGVEGAEVIMWLVMRGALSPKIRKLHQSYYLPSMTGIATAIYEDDVSAPPANDSMRGRLEVTRNGMRRPQKSETVPSAHLASSATGPSRPGRRSGLLGAHESSACRHRKAGRHLSVHPRAQRQGLPVEQVPAQADRRRVAHQVQGRSGNALRRGRPQR